jgi:hypothetical protein
MSSFSEIPNDLLSLSMAAKMIRAKLRDRKSITTYSVRRWLVDGVSVGRGKVRVKLEGYRVGGNWYTSEQQLDAFFSALNDPDNYVRRCHNQRVEKAKAKLEKAGC